MGEAFIKQVLTEPVDAKYTGNAIISAVRGPYTLAHELGHILLRDPGHDPQPTNLMYFSSGFGATIRGPKRLDSVQEYKLHNNPLLK